VLASAKTASFMAYIQGEAAVRAHCFRSFLPTLRPDSVVDPNFDGFHGDVSKLGEWIRHP
jgi:glucuronate isomerase